MSRMLAFGLALWAADFAATSPAVSAQNDATVTALLQPMVSNFHSRVSFYAHDLATGRTVDAAADQPVPTACLIKLAILYEGLQQIHEGRVHFGDRLAQRRENQVQGSGYCSSMTLQ
jgi:beta-lactamase class A